MLTGDETPSDLEILIFKWVACWVQTLARLAIYPGRFIGWMISDRAAWTSRLPYISFIGRFGQKL